MAHRLEKIQSQIKRILGEIFIKKSQSFDIGLITINDILVSRDLSQAKVWVSFIGEQDQRMGLKKLKKHRIEIQSLFYKQMPIKKVPKLLWYVDSDVNRIVRIEEILDDIKRERTKNIGIQEED